MMIKEVPKTSEEFGKKKKTSEQCGSSPVLILPISPAEKQGRRGQKIEERERELKVEIKNRKEEKDRETGEG